jgi:hypothetical protein
VPQGGLHLRCGDSAFQNLPCHVEAGEFIEWEVDAAAIEVFIDVPDEVRQLERHAQIHRTLVRLG